MDQTNIEDTLLYLDCSSGISGDMVVGALLDLGADSAVLTEALASLPLTGYRVEIRDVFRSGLRMKDFSVILSQDNHDHDMEYLFGNRGPEHTSKEALTQPAHTHTHSHSHERGIQEIYEILSAGKLSDSARELAKKIFRIVAEAESQVHGKPLENVHFHEIGAVDSIVDIAAAAVCLDNLGIDRTVITSLTDGSGQIRCQHGLLPIPVPATAAIVSAHQIPLRIASVQGELTTPTGAAIAAAIRTDSALPGEFELLRTGMSCGKRSYDPPSILRAMLIKDLSRDEKVSRADENVPPAKKEDTQNSSPDPYEHDKIFVMETNLDDCSGETMGFVMDELLKAGALDVFCTPVFMKKQRPGFLLTVLCSNKQRQGLEKLIFLHTTSIGIRIHPVERTKLPRRILKVQTPWGMADVKCCQDGEKVYYYPESDSIRRLANERGESYEELYEKVKMYAADPSVKE